MSFPVIPKLYRDNDTIYHYTTSETALSHILKSMELRLSSRSQSSDPIENTEHFFSYSNGNPGEGIPDDAYRLTNETKEMLIKTKQVCFCKNNSLENENGMTFPPFEKYGFAKPRMWDQYGDKYKGVCLAFSLRKLTESAQAANIKGNDIEYITYNDYEVRHSSINIPRLKQDGFDKYKEEYTENLKTLLFNKHKDYINENEYRLYSFVDGIYDYIDIKNALVGVIISNLIINPFLYQGFASLLTSYPDIDIKILNFRDQTLSIESYLSRLKRFESIAQHFKNRQ